jgi:hypothetical protein
MDLDKSLDEIELIAALLHDIHMSHGVVFNTKALRLTLQKVRQRVSLEGIGFLTKTLPKLGKAFDKAISGGSPLTAVDLGFKSQENSVLPKFLGEFFSRVLTPQGVLLESPCNDSVGIIRQITYLFYKYELPYDAKQEQEVVSQFEETERDLDSLVPKLQAIAAEVHDRRFCRRGRKSDQAEVAREARILLSRLFARFDPRHILPCHGPGAVATKQRLWNKYKWTNVSDRITSYYPFDAYFCASLGEVCDTMDRIASIPGNSLPARVILVPKDSRGPRLISCEPVDNQWVQQGLGRAIVKHVESHELTKFNVMFTDQSPNQRGALLGSQEPVLPQRTRYSTLDLKEASDRVSTELVRLLFPPDLFEAMDACRSLATVLPNGSELELRKFAPMGSCLCFPTMALCIWSILTAAAPDTDTREGILVYGDDVIVPTAYAANAIEQLESFGLKVNHDKSCTGGLFRESCGVDAFNGKNVTPVRLRTVWSSTRAASVYCSWIAYANSFYDKRCYRTYDYIVSRLVAVYGPIPSEEQVGKRAPSLRDTILIQGRVRSRTNKRLQRREYSVWVSKAPSITYHMNGWSKLLRYFTEGQRADMSIGEEKWQDPHREVEPFSTSRYTDRHTSMLVRRWR